MDRKQSDSSFSFAVEPPFASAASNPFLSAPPGPFRSIAGAGSVEAVWSQDTRADDDDAPSAEAIDVRILWGTNVLYFEQMSPPRPFTVGDAGSDFALGEVGASAASGGSSPLVIVREERASVFVAAGVTAHVKLVSGSVLSLLLCVEKGIAQGSPDRTDAHEILLPQGAIATLSFPRSELVFEVSRVRARRKPVVAFWEGADLSGHIYTGLSALVHVSLLGALAFFLPNMRGDDAEAVDRNALAAMQPYLDAIAEKEPEHLETVTELESVTPSGGGRGSQAAGPSSAMGNPVSSHREPARLGIRGDAPDTKLAHERAVVEAAQFGFLGILNTDAPSAIRGPIAAWADVAEGHDAKNGLASMWAPSIDDTWGPGGLGLSGTDQGGGGFAHGIGIDGIGSTVGHGTGDWPADGPGRGPGHDYGPGGVGHSPRGLRGHEAGAPNPRALPITTFNGTLPKEVVQRIVRQNFGRFRLCYEAGLRSNPGLTGRVAVAFVIDRNGGVAVASADRSTDMADPNVVSCVVRGFQNLSFPAPKDGTVQVIYPLMLAPDQ